MDMENMSILTTEEKVVQMCDIINLMDARIKELEVEVEPFLVMFEKVGLPMDLVLLILNVAAGFVHAS